MFKFTNIQQKAKKLLASVATHILLRGGSRSGKTFIILFAIVVRALCAPGSRHAVLGFRFNRVKTAVGMDTFPKMMSLCFPGIQYHHDKQEWFYQFNNGSQIWLCGLDDQERTEKVLGKEFCTIFFNECSQISADARDTALTRLAQKVTVQTDGGQDRELRLKAYYDENPPKKSHWSYRLFFKKTNPVDGTPVRNPDDYVTMLMNPADNEENLPEGYMDTLNNLSAAKRRRFRDGEFAESDPNQLFDEDTFEKYRVIDLDELPDMVRFEISVDPSGIADGEEESKKDAIGIIAGGVGVDGVAYIMEDLTVSAGPTTWGKVAVNAYHYHSADRIIGEVNFGGGMVKFVIRTIDPHVPFKTVTATKGKHVRAEPIASLYEQGRVRHVGRLNELEAELADFTTHGYNGAKSPNRADALIWLVFDLFPELLPKEKAVEEIESFQPSDPGAGY